MDLATLTRETVKAIRESKIGSRINLVLPCEVRQIGEPSDRTLRFTASNEMVDRYRTIIKADGWDLKNWLANPVIQYGHDSSQPPIGHGVRAERESYVRADGKADRRLAIDVKYEPREVYPFADMLYQMALSGTLRAVSVGFDILEKRDPTAEEIKQYGLPEKDHGITVLARNELYELSVVNIPGNPLALIDTLSSVLPEVRSAKPEDVTEEWLGEKLELCRRNLSADGDWTKELDKPLTERRLRQILTEFFGQGEKRMGDCLRGLAKRTEVTNLSLQVEDLSKQVKTLEAKRAAAPAKPTNLYDDVLIKKQLADITKNLKGA